MAAHVLAVSRSILCGEEVVVDAGLSIMHVVDQLALIAGVARRVSNVDCCKVRHLDRLATVSTVDKENGILVHGLHTPVVLSGVYVRSCTLGLGLKTA